MLVGVTWLLAGCELVALYGAYRLVDQYINRNKGDKTTRIVYAVETSSAGNAAVVGARIEMFALKLGGDPQKVTDYDTVADAVRLTNDQGEAVVYVQTSPYEAGDNIIRPAVTYRYVVTAPGFQTFEGVQSPVADGAGLVEPNAIRLVPTP